MDIPLSFNPIKSLYLSLLSFQLFYFKHQNICVYDSRSVFFFLFLYTIWHKTLFQLHEDAVEYEEREAGGHQLLSLVCLVVLVETWTVLWGLIGNIFEEYKKMYTLFGNPTSKYLRFLF